MRVVVKLIRFILDSKRYHQILVLKERLRASIQSVADSLTTGKLSADSLPIEYIVRDGKMITMNNRSLTALSKANMKPTVLIDITGDAK